MKASVLIFYLFLVFISGCSASSNSNNSDLYDSGNSGSLTFSSNGYDSWMTDNWAYLRGKKLGEIVIPGSHDAGMYTARYCSEFDYKIGTQKIVYPCHTMTQLNDIEEQLNMGIRYFDLRPVYSTFDGDWVLGHWNGYPMGLANWDVGCSGGYLENVLDAVKNFALSHPREIVILHFSHYGYLTEKGIYKYWNYNDDELRRFALANLIIYVMDDRFGLKEHLVGLPTTGGNLGVKTLDELNSYGPNRNRSIIILFDDLDYYAKDDCWWHDFEQYCVYANPTCQKYMNDQWPHGIFSSSQLKIFNDYAGTNDVSDMYKDQYEKMIGNWHDNYTTFLLSWTMTQSKGDALRCSSCVDEYSVLGLAQKANDAFESRFLNGRFRYQSIEFTKSHLPSILYFDRVNEKMTDYALNINSILLNTPDGCREETAKWPSPPIDNPDWNTNLQKLIRENSCPGCDLHSMVFRNPVYLVDDTNLRGANLSGSFLYGTMINRAFLSDANLSGSKMINVSLAASNFDRADMSRVNMSSNCGASDLSNAYFFDAILQGADLTGANLKGSYLTRANMQNANLTGANLTRAELYDADLTNANLYNADLTDAVLTGAKTSGATWTDGRICDQGSTGPCRRCAWKCTQRCIEWEYEPGMKWPMCIKWEESCKFEDCIDP